MTTETSFHIICIHVYMYICIVVLFKLIKISMIKKIFFINIILIYNSYNSYNIKGRLYKLISFCIS